MKRTVLVWIILLSILAAPNSPGFAAQEDPPFVIGTMTALSGNFFAGLWGMNTSDIDIRLLLHAYATMEKEARKGRALEPNRIAMERMDLSEDEHGNQVHRFTLKNDLFFSDGSQITAEDYAFSVLLLYSPEIRELGGTAPGAEPVIGGRAYQRGEAERLLGLRLIDKFRFSITIGAENYPYFYNLAYVNITPYPVRVLAPGCQVKDSPEGAYIEGPFDSALLEETLMDGDAGYLSHPKVTSGPYRLESFDREQATASLSVNPYYKGNLNGVKPSIQRLRVIPMVGIDIVQALKDGELHLANKVSFVQVRQQAERTRGISVTNYDREGLAFLAFLTEQDAVDDVRVRQAIAHCLDKPAIAHSFLGPYGKEVDGFYGLGQWMYKETGGNLPGLKRYPFDLRIAGELLSEAGFAYDSQGAPYISEASETRYAKDADGTLLPLMLRAGIPEDNTAAELTLSQLEASLEKLGARLEIKRMDIQTLLKIYYAQTERNFDLLFLSSNFSEFFDPYYTFHTDPAYRGVLNSTFIQDEELMRRALAMRASPCDDFSCYLRAWQAFQERFTQVLPMVPLYGNSYADLYTARLTGYHPENHISYATAIIEAKYR